MLAAAVKDANMAAAISILHVVILTICLRVFIFPPPFQAVLGKLN